MEAVVKKPSKPSEKKFTHVKNDMVEDKEDKVENRKDGEMEIKQLDLNELIENDTSSDEEEGEDENKEKTPISLTKSGQKSQEKAKVKKDSFFLGAGSDDGSDDEVSDDADDDVMGIVVSQLDWLSGLY